MRRSGCRGLSRRRGTKDVAVDGPRSSRYEFVYVHLQLRRHQYLLWPGMQLEFVFDNGAAATTRGVQAGDLIVTCANQLGVHIQSSRAVCRRTYINSIFLPPVQV